MHYPLTHYNGIGYGESHDLEAEAAHDLAVVESSMDSALDTLEETGSEVAAGIASVVEESRQFAEHRKAIYMVGAPLIVYVGLTNTKHKGLGLISALAGLYLGVKNYQDEKDSEQAAAALGGYGVAGSPFLSHLPPRLRPKCVHRKPGRRCPRHLRLRYRADGTALCCRR